MAFAGFALLVLAGCEKDDLPPAVNDAEVTFVFKKHAVYSLNSLLDAASVKFVLSDGIENDTLPSMPLSGTADSLSTPGYKLNTGTYQIVSFRLFAANATQIYEATVKEGEMFEVIPGQATAFEIPADVYVHISNQPIKNILLGICLETFGPDKSLWPWNDDVSIYEWEGLEFDLDYGFVNGLVLDERFRSLKRLPESIGGIVTLENIHITDCQLEELPDALEMMNVRAIFLKNTSLSKLKPSFFRQKKLNSLYIENAPLQEIPGELGSLKELYTLYLMDLPVTVLPASIGSLPKLEALYLNGCELETLPLAIGDLPHLHQLVLTDTKLSKLPTTINDLPILRTLNLNGCQFTSFPAALKNNSTIVDLQLKGNPMTALSNHEMGVLSNLKTLNISQTGISNLSGLAASSVPNLQELVMATCNLTEAPVLPVLPELIYVSLEGNSISTLSNSFFPIVNGKSSITYLVLKGNQLTSLPADFGVIDGKVSLNYVDLSDNPQLVWRIPTAWKEANVYVNLSNTQVSQL